MQSIPEFDKTFLLGEVDAAEFVAALEALIKEYPSNEGADWFIYLLDGRLAIENAYSKRTVAWQHELPERLARCFTFRERSIRAIARKHQGRTGRIKVAFGSAGDDLYQCFTALGV